jgi:hypothetical protein
MRPGNFWQYLLICWVGYVVADSKVLPIGKDVAAVYQQVIDGFQGKHQDGGVTQAACGWTGRLPLRVVVVRH